MSGVRPRLLFPAALLAAGCSGGWHPQPLPTPASRPPVPAGWFQAGAATVDITPPPGVGLAGRGPESPRSTGYRTRLSLHALVLEDATGERIALVVADLPHVSANLHRLAADRLAQSVGIGADRLIVSATHTHSSFAHFYGERQYNANVSRVPGYDPRIVEFLVARITTAVEAAARTLAPAVAASGTVSIVGATVNRSLAAFCRNFDPPIRPNCEAQPPAHAVDTLLFMLRVDRLDRPSGHTTPLASYSSFPIHGTGLPSQNTLLDGDIHVRVLQRLSAHVAALGGAPGVHALANGNEGDVAPAVRRDPVCGTPRIGPADRFPMPVGPAEVVDFVAPAPWRAARCVQYGIAEVERIADSVAKGMIGLYDVLGGRLTSEVPIRRAFSTEWLPGTDGLCGLATMGSAAAAGAEGAETRVRGWRWLFWPLVTLGLEEGGSAVQPRPERCQAPKRTLLGPLQARFVGVHGFPETAQLTVVRIGAALLGAVPAEATSIAGQRMTQEMARASTANGWTPGQTVLIGLANGFLQYVTTAAEYQWQAYEGGSTLYGPGTAAFLEQRLGQLAGTLPTSAAAPSPPALIGPITAYPGPPSQIMALPAPSTTAVGPISLSCGGGRLVGKWNDGAPGAIFPLGSSWVRLSVNRNGAWVPSAHDGDGALEIHFDGPAGRSGEFRWRAAWVTAPDPGSRYRLERLDSAGAPLRTSAPASCP